MQSQARLACARHTEEGRHGKINKRYHKRSLNTAAR